MDPLEQETVIYFASLIVVLDSAGAPLQLTSQSSETGIGDASGYAGLIFVTSGEPAKVRVSLPTKLHRMEIPFDFKGIPLR